MSISTFWIVTPIVTSLLLLLGFWYYYFYFLKKKKKSAPQKEDVDIEKNFLDGYCPPEEVPIICIRPQYGKVRKGGLFQVAFATTGKDTFYWLTASEIVTRCRRHGQKIPFIVGCDKDILLNKKGRTHLALGDDLLERKK